ncbi:methyl-accepting chemotaxis protein [Paenibacillus sp. SC116]|uniref:methyl-accepting chemotaxis protein n=1 Tax=Paenibacillus sp. SC116 TaxID=2968986 RepID=UPI00215AC212|nr:methyl-accepting chemotaxis protein [Paenibacillus sp. SC116]MCR8846530.1 methyl-accepting chemotaxis protein [Paenibacillus sp. SC116]
MNIFSSVKVRLIISFAFILLVPSIVIGVISYNSASSIVKKEMETAIAQNIKLLNDQIDGTIDESDANIKYLSNIIKAKGDNGADNSPVRELLNEFQELHPNLASTFVGTTDGVMIQSPKMKLAENYDPRNSAWYKESMTNKGKVVITSPRMTDSTNEMVVTIARSLEDGSGAVAMNLKLKHLMNIAQDVKIGHEGYIIMLSKDKQIMVHPTRKLGSNVSEEKTWVDPMYKDKQGMFTYEFEGDSKEMGFLTNEKTGWKVAGTMYSEEYGNASQPIMNTTIIVVAIAVAIGTAIVFFIIRSILNPLNRLRGVAHAVSGGNLQVRLNASSKDEFGELSRSFDAMTDSLRSVLNEVSDASLHLSSSSQELAAASEQSAQASQYTAESMTELAAGSEQQVNQMNQADTIVGELAVGARQIANSSQSVAEAATLSSDVVVEGSRSIKQAVQQMESINSSVTQLGQSMSGLSEQARSIDNIVTAITGIAGQTNLLALNASIEAARAGEHGRGFAVVASEVRKLAEQSSLMAQQIAETIQHIQAEMLKSAQNTETSAAEVKLGIKVIHEAGSAFQRMESAVQVVATQIQEVSASSEQMAAGTDEMSGYINEMKAVTEQAADHTKDVSATAEQQLASMQQISSSAEELSRMAERLGVVISKFKL